MLGNPLVRCLSFLENKEVPSYGLRNNPGRLGGLIGILLILLNPE